MFLLLFAILKKNNSKLLKLPRLKGFYVDTGVASVITPEDEAELLKRAKAVLGIKDDKPKKGQRIDQETFGQQDENKASSREDLENLMQSEREKGKEKAENIFVDDESNTTLIKPNATRREGFVDTEQNEEVKENFEKKSKKYAEDDENINKNAQEMLDDIISLTAGKKRDVPPKRPINNKANQRGKQSKK